MEHRLLLLPMLMFAALWLPYDIFYSVAFGISLSAKYAPDPLSQSAPHDPVDVSTQAQPSSLPLSG